MVNIRDGIEEILKANRAGLGGQSPSYPQNPVVVPVNLSGIQDQRLYFEGTIAGNRCWSMQVHAIMRYDDLNRSTDFSCTMDVSHFVSMDSSRHQRTVYGFPTVKFNVAALLYRALGEFLDVMGVAQ